MDDVLASDFERGVDAYWSGEEPQDWNNAESRARSPFLIGWYMASLWETQPGYLRDEEFVSYQEGEDWDDSEEDEDYDEEDDDLEDRSDSTITGHPTQPDRTMGDLYS